jgi:glycosyltransferase involved in cell wall biosynthesis
MAVKYMQPNFFKRLKNILASLWLRVKTLMRIAIDARYAVDHFPGIGRYIYNLLRALAALDHPHTLVVLHTPALPNSRYDMAALADLPSVELVVVGARPFSAAEHVAIPRLLRRLNVDLYHAPYYVRPYVGVACPAVVTLYDLIPRLFPAEVSLRARLLFDMLTRLAIRSSRQLIAISESGRADIAAMYRLPAARIAVTPLAADPRFRPQPPAVVAAVRAKYGLPENYIFALSSNKPHKNLPRLIEAFARVVQGTDHDAGPTPGDPQLVIAGHWDPRYPQARELAAQLGLESSVCFLQGVPETDLAALYSGAMLFAFPSLYEGFGLPPLEALACGAAVLSGATSSLPEVLGDAAFYVDAHSVVAIADGLRRLLSDAALRVRLRTAAPLRAAMFSWHRTAMATLEVYEKFGA